MVACTIRTPAMLGADVLHGDPGFGPVRTGRAASTNGRRHSGSAAPPGDPGEYRHIEQANGQDGIDRPLAPAAP